MVRKLLALARDSRFIPSVYNYCDMWCERCPITSRCLVFASEQGTTAQSGRGRLRDRLKETLELTRAMIATISPADISTADPDPGQRPASTPPRPSAIGHPLEFLARHYAVQASAFLRSLHQADFGDSPRGSPLETVCWYYTLIPAKTYRALTSDIAAKTDSPELQSDALGSAKVVLLSIDSSLAAWQTLAAGGQDARIGGLIELLEALRTGVELRFPDARPFIRPGLDDLAGGG